MSSFRTLRLWAMREGPKIVDLSDREGFGVPRRALYRRTMPTAQFSLQSENEDVPLCANCPKCWCMAYCAKKKAIQI